METSIIEDYQWKCVLVSGVPLQTLVSKGHRGTFAQYMVGQAALRRLPFVQNNQNNSKENGKTTKGN